MPKYDLKMDERRRVTLPEPIANDMGKKLHLSPNTVTALLYSKGVPLEDVIKSTELLIQMLKHELDLKKKR